MTGGGGILPRGYIQVQGILFSNSINLSVNVTDSRKPTEMVSEFCVVTQPSTWDSILGYWQDDIRCYNRLGVSHSHYVPVADSNKIYYRKQSGANTLAYMQELILHKWYNFHAFADGKMTLNKELYHYEDVGNTLYSYSELHLNFNARTNVYGHLAFVYDGNIQFDLYPCITPSGVVAFFDKAKNEILSVSSPIAYLTSLQALNLSKLPIVESGTLTVSLPWDAQWNIGVQNALSIAATRGWTITVQYRDPEVATTPIPIGFLESTGTQRIDAGLRYSSNDTYSQTLDLSITDKNHAGNTGVNYLGWCSVKNGTYYMLNETPNAPIGERDIIYNKFLNKERFLYVNGSEVTRHAEQYAASDIIAGIFALGNVNSAWWWETDKNIKAKLYSAKFTKNDVLARDMLPALDSTGTPCLYDLVTKQTFYNDGTGAFIAGFNTIEQSMKLATLPDVTAETDTAKKSLTVSLPWEAQLVITGVPAALQVAADRGWTITVQYRDPEADNAYYNKYAKCVTIADMFAVNSQYVADLTAKDEWIYPLSSFKSGNCIFGWAYGDYPNGRPTPIKVFNADMPIATNIAGMFMRCLNLEAIKGQFTKVTHTAEMCWGCQKLSVVEAEFPALYWAGSMFSQCQLNKESILRVLNSIPSYTSGTHPLTIGIHTDLQTDEEVTTAIANAEAKGWTLTVQWNGTATAAAASVSTFGLRSPVIYAKLITIEQPDSTTKQVLDWGHYVTNWEENGYQEFSSVEEAEEYFNINQTEEL